MEIYAFYNERNDVALEVYPIVAWDRHSTNKYHQVVGGLPIIPLDKSKRMNDSTLIKYYIRYHDDVYCPREKNITFTYDEMRKDVTKFRPCSFHDDEEISVRGRRISPDSASSFSDEEPGYENDSDYSR